MSFLLSWKFLVGVVALETFAVYGLIDAARALRRQPGKSGGLPGQALNWRLVGYAIFVGGPLFLAAPCVLARFDLTLATPTVLVLLVMGVADILLGGAFLIAAGRPS